MSTLEIANKRIPIIAGTGANATSEAISLTKRFEKSWKWQDIRDCIDVQLRVYATEPKETCVYMGLLNETCVYTLL